MYTINIRGKQNPKDTKMVKLEIIFFKTGYARVPKVINITGLLKDWDVKSQSFRVGSAEATTKNKLLFDLRTKYLHVADTWEMEGRNWSPVQLSHCFDEIKAAKPEAKDRDGNKYERYPSSSDFGFGVALCIRGDEKHTADKIAFYMANGFAVGRYRVAG